MVLEGLINPMKAEKRPWEMFFVGILYSSIAIAISLFLFMEYASLIAIFFTVIASIPIIYAAIKLEEKKDLVIHDEKVLIKEHGKALAFFMFLFLGFVVSFSLWYTFLPPEISAKVFEIQSSTISKINDPIAGNAFNLAGTFGKILMNNIKVLVFCLIFALEVRKDIVKKVETWSVIIVGTIIQ